MSIEVKRTPIFSDSDLEAEHSALHTMACIIAQKWMLDLESKDCSFSYDGLKWFYEDEIAEAKKELENFIRRMKREYEKQGLEFKWIAVTEFHHKRIHHHIVMPYIDERVITRQWKRGHVNFKSLDRKRKILNFAAVESIVIVEEE